MTVGMNPAVIPIFNVEPDQAAFAHACSRLRLGEKNYEFQDVITIANWVGVCAFMYMADQYADGKQKIITAEDLQTKDFYHNQCGHVSSITNDILSKLNVNLTICYTQKPCEDLLNHVSVFSIFEPKEGAAGIFFDHSLRQYFKTNAQGVLLENRGPISGIDNIPSHFLANETTKKLADELLLTGSACVSCVEDIQNYVSVFVNNVADIYRGGYQRDHLTLEERTKQFFCQYSYHLNTKYSKWTTLPDEPEGQELLQRYADIYQRCLIA